MTTYLEELRERYIGVCDGHAEIIGNQLFIYDYNKDCMSSRLNEDFEDDFTGNDVVRIDEYKELARLDYYRILVTLDKAENMPKVEEVKLSLFDKEKYESVFVIGQSKLTYYSNGKLVVEGHGLYDNVLVEIQDEYYDKLETVTLILTDTETLPF